MRWVQVLEQQAKLFLLRVCKVHEFQSEAERWCLVRNLAGKLKPLSVRQLQFEDDHFADLGFAERIDVTATFRQVRDTGKVIPAFSVPDGVKTNIPSLFASAVVAHS